MSMSGANFVKAIEQAQREPNTPYDLKICHAIDHPDEVLPWTVHQEITETRTVHMIDGSTHDVIARTEDTNIVLGAISDAPGKFSTVPLCWAASPRVARFIVDAVNEMCSKKKHELSPDELLRATENVISSAKFEKTTDTDLAATLKQASAANRDLVNKLEIARLEVTRLTAANSVSQDQVNRFETSDRRKDITMGSYKEEIKRLEKTIREYEQKDQQRIARETGTIKQGGSGRRMRFKEKSDVEQDQGIDAVGADQNLRSL